ncbi:MAG: DNA repair protein RecO [Syntrophales bacterium]|nr:DNA repair protein RecO [Syntrophales bacterium]MDY0043937.1 DNA repair protein RecO [Syntrophales bacterium]
MQNKATGFVLNFRDYGESDRIVTFFTDQTGKLKGIAKGARRSQKRFANAIEPFSLSAIIFSRRRAEGLCLIEDCRVLNHFPRIREDLEKTLMASYFIDLADSFTEEGAVSHRLFKHMSDFLNLLEAEKAGESIMRLFEFRLLCISGYEPTLGHCISCRKPVESLKEISFGISDGGIKCEKCAPLTAGRISISPGTARTLVAGKNMPVEKLRRLIFTEYSLRESRLFLVPLIRHITGRQLKSLNVLMEVKHLTDTI